MQTRNNKRFVKGVYSKIIIHNSFSNENLSRKNFKKERLDLSILHKLKNTDNVQKVVSLNVSSSLKNFLIKRYKLSKRFTNCTCFLTDFDYNPVNYYTKRNFCKIQRNIQN